jgi:hypothetical protein
MYRLYIFSLSKKEKMKNIFMTFATILLLASALDGQWSDYQAAEFVIGQPDFTTNANARSAIGLAGPYSVAIDLQHSKLYIGDADNHRVLRYAYPITGNQPTAELVFGQSDFTTDAAQTFYNNMGFWPTPTANQILYPMAIAVYNGDLWVLDEFNNRVVKFSQAYNQTINNPDADLVIGQQTFTTNSSACTINSFTTPWGMTIDGNGNLWVADAGNRRVLRFNDASDLTNGYSANGVFGQTDFTTGTITSVPTQYQFGLPSSLYFDGTTLWVCDREFNRVLRFNDAAAKPDGANADGVLGQSSFTTSAAGITPSAFNQPFGVCADGKGNLYVSDQANNRVVIFLNAANKENGASADNVLGQASFYVNSYTYGSKSFAPGSVTNFAIDNTNGKLFVVDRRGMRVLQFAASNNQTGINQNELPVLKPFQLSNYPNPFNSVTTISFMLPSELFVSLIVFDDIGRQLSVLVSKELSAGTYEYQWKAADLPDGVYFCQLQVDRIVEMQKLILQR